MDKPLYLPEKLKDATTLGAGAIQYQQNGDERIPDGKVDSMSVDSFLGTAASSFLQGLEAINKPLAAAWTSQITSWASDDKLVKNSRLLTRDSLVEYFKNDPDAEALAKEQGITVEQWADAQATQVFKNMGMGQIMIEGATATYPQDEEGNLLPMPEPTMEDLATMSERMASADLLSHVLFILKDEDEEVLPTIEGNSADTSALSGPEFNEFSEWFQKVNPKLYKQLFSMEEVELEGEGDLKTEKEGELADILAEMGGSPKAVNFDQLKTYWGGDRQAGEDAETSLMNLAIANEAVKAYQQYKARLAAGPQEAAPEAADEPEVAPEVSAEEKIAELNDSLTDKAVEIVNLKKVITKADKLLKAKEAELAQAKAEGHGLADLVITGAAVFAGTIGLATLARYLQKRRAPEKVDRLQKEVTQLKKSVANGQAKVTELQGEIDSKKRELATVEKERDAGKAQIKQLSEAARQLKEENGELKKDLTAEQLKNLRGEAGSAAPQAAPEPAPVSVPGDATPSEAEDRTRLAIPEGTQVGGTPEKATVAGVAVVPAAGPKNVHSKTTAVLSGDYSVAINELMQSDVTIDPQQVAELFEADGLHEEFKAEFGHIRSVPELADQLSAEELTAVIDQLNRDKQPGENLSEMGADFLGIAIVRRLNAKAAAAGTPMDVQIQSDLADEVLDRLGKDAIFENDADREEIRTERESRATREASRARREALRRTRMAR